MNTITLTKQEIQNILDGEYIKGDFEKHYRHNGGYQDVIFKRDDKYFMFVYRIKLRDGATERRRL